MIIRNILAGALFGFMMLAASSQVFAQSELVEKRQNLMKNNSAAVKAIKGAVDAKDYATIELKAKDIMSNAEKIPALFPKGSNVGKTKAKVEIWEKADDFAKNDRNLRKAATELADAAKSKDDAAIGVKVKALGDVCGACHKANRAEKYAE